MWAQEFLSAHMLTWHREKITLGLQLGFGNAKLFTHRALFPGGGICVCEAPAWIWKHSDGVPTPLRLSCSSCQSWVLFPVSLALNMFLGIPSLAPWCSPQPALKQSPSGMQVPRLLQAWVQRSSLRLQEYHPPSTCPGCVRLWNGPVSFHLPLCPNLTAAYELLWGGCHFKILLSSRDLLYTKATGKRCLWPIVKAEGPRRPLSHLTTHCEIPGLDMNPVCLGPCQGRHWAQPLQTGVLVKEATSSIRNSKMGLKKSKDSASCHTRTGHLSGLFYK